MVCVYVCICLLDTVKKMNANDQSRVAIIVVCKCIDRVYIQRGTRWMGRNNDLAWASSSTLEYLMANDFQCSNDDSHYYWSDIRHTSVQAVLRYGHRLHSCSSSSSSPIGTEWQ